MSAAVPSVSGLRLLAWANVAVHLAGLAFAAAGMAPGTPLVSLPERLDYLAGSPLGWTLGWVSWMLCAALLVAFLAVTVHALGEDAFLARLGLTIAIAGAAFDFFCDSVFIVVLPTIAAARPRSESLFLAIERLTSLGSLVIANGAYSIAIVMVNNALYRRGMAGPVTAVLGYAVGAGGLVLVAAGFTAVPWHVQWATPPTILLFCVWAVLVARSLAAGGRA